MASTAKTAASWTLRLAAIALTLVCVVVIFAVRFSANGNEMQAVVAAGVPVVCGFVGAYLLGMIKRFSHSRFRWQAYVYVMLAVTAYLIVRVYI